VSQHQRRFGGLFWRLSASYFVATLAAASIGTYVGRFNGPFGDFRDNPLVRWFDRVGDNNINSGVLFVVLAALMGTLTGVLVSFNLTRRLGRITRAAEAWSAGDFAATARDASRDELGQLARDLNRMAEQLHALLTTRQELAVVEERNRLARDLHDTVKQHVFANALLVRAARKQVDRDPAIAKRHLQDAEGLAEQTQHELITLIRALRPAALADKGLLAVLGEFAHEWSARTGIAVDLRAQGERATPLEVEDALLRVVQLAWEGERLRLSVRDDGNGFDVAAAEGKGLGLASMRERVEALGGALVLASASGETCVEACVPLAGASLPTALEVAHE
jgi:NarL family two-component system sensor histidine kinase LiaS